MRRLPLSLLLSFLLLLAYMPAEAASYLRVTKKGVIFYYFDQRGEIRPEAPPSRPEGRLPRPRPPRTAAVALPPVEPPQLVWQFLPAETVTAATVADQPTPLSIHDLLTVLGFFLPPRLPAVLPEAAPPDDQTVDLTAAPLLPRVNELTCGRLLFLTASGRLWRGFDRGNPAHMFPLPGGGSAVRQVAGIYCFPVAQPCTFRDSWGEPREGGRWHKATDIAAAEGTEVYAVTSGVIHAMGFFNRAGNTIFLRGHDGRGYSYMHLLAYAPGIQEGQTVAMGQVIGYVGRTGTVNSAPHLHFEVYPDHRFGKDSLLNPYDFLVQLCRGVGVADLGQPRPQPRPVRTAALRAATPWPQAASRPWLQNQIASRPTLHYKIPLPTVLPGGPTAMPGPPKPAGQPQQRTPAGILLPPGYSLRILPGSS